MRGWTEDGTEVELVPWQAECVRGILRWNAGGASFTLPSRGMQGGKSVVVATVAHLLGYSSHNGKELVTAESRIQPGDPLDPREALGRLVRQVWLEWAREQLDPKPSWLLSWEELDDGQREVDMRIGDALFEAGKKAARDD